MPPFANVFAAICCPCRVVHLPACLVFSVSHLSFYHGVGNPGVDQILEDKGKDLIRGNLCTKILQGGVCTVVR